MSPKRQQMPFYVEPENYQYLCALARTYSPTMFERGQNNSNNGVLNSLLRLLKQAGFTDFEQIRQSLNKSVPRGTSDIKK